MLNNFQQGDIKYYWRLHVKKMQAKGELPVSYSPFTRRLKKMNLHDAIETPRAEYNVRNRESKTPIQDSIRRVQKLKEANIQILDLDELVSLEAVGKPKRKVEVYTKSMIQPPKKSIWKRFTSLFK